MDKHASTKLQFTGSTKIEEVETHTVEPQIGVARLPSLSFCSVNKVAFLYNIDKLSTIQKKNDIIADINNKINYKKKKKIVMIANLFTDLRVETSSSFTCMSVTSEKKKKERKKESLIK